MLDLQKNTSNYSLNRATHFPYFLQITDGLTHLIVLLGLSEVSAAAIFECLLHYAIWLKPNPNFHIEDIDKVHIDVVSAFKSAEFISDCEQHGIKVTFAAPRHQEMNEIVNAHGPTFAILCSPSLSMRVLAMNIIHLH